MTDFALLVMTDGRDHIFESIPSALGYLQGGTFSELWIHDDSGGEKNRAKLRRVFPDFEVVGPPRRSGFGGAIRSAWSELEARSEARFVFHLEDDFVFRRIVNISELGYVLDRDPALAQMALRRQPVNPREVAAGGVVEEAPHDFTDRADSLGHQWLEHRRFFTTNPNLQRADLRRRGWPTGEQSEGRFSAELFADPAVRSGYWGARDSGEWVGHIGNTRRGTGY